MVSIDRSIHPPIFFNGNQVPDQFRFPREVPFTAIAYHCMVCPMHIHVNSKICEGEPKRWEREPIVRDWEARCRKEARFWKGNQVADNDMWNRYSWVEVARLDRWHHPKSERCKCAGPFLDLVTDWNCDCKAINKMPYTFLNFRIC